MNQGRSSTQSTAHAAELSTTLKSYALTGTIFYAFAVFIATLVRLEAGESISVGSSALFLAILAASFFTASLRFSITCNSSSNDASWTDYFVAIGPAVCSVFAVALLSEMSSDQYTIFVMQFTLVSAECISLFFMIPPVFFHAKKTSLTLATPTASAEPKPTPPSPALDITLPQEPPSEPDDENTPTWRFDEPSEPAPHILPQNVTQQLTRAVEEGTEVLHGQVRAEFAADQRHESIHVAFCPPLDGIPEVELMQLEGPEVSVKPAVVQPHGARFDLQRSGDSTQAATVVMEFFASVAVGVK